MNIKISATAKELKDLGLTTEQLQDLVINRVDSMTKNNKKLFWNVELSCEAVVENPKSKNKL